MRLFFEIVGWGANPNKKLLIEIQCWGSHPNLREERGFLHHPLPGFGSRMRLQ